MPTDPDLTLTTDALTQVGGGGGGAVQGAQQLVDYGTWKDKHSIF